MLTCSIPPFRVIAIVDGDIPSVELCVTIPFDQLQADGALTYTLHREDDLPPDGVWRAADIIVTMRSTTAAVVRFAKSVVNAGIPFIYMVDDDFGAIPVGHWLGRHYRAVGAGRNVARLVKLATLTMTYSEEMYMKLSSLSSATILAPSISGLFLEREGEEDTLGTDELVDEIRIGYAASATHERDVGLIADVLREVIIEHDGRVAVESIGQRISKLDGLAGYRHFDEVKGLREFGRFLAGRNWAIGVAPMEIAPVNEAKTDNKYRTYASAGIAGVYTRLPAFDRSVMDGRTGILVDNDPTSWKAALTSLIKDSAARKTIGMAAREDYRARYDLSLLSGLYLDSLRKSLRAVRALVATAGRSECGVVGISFPVQDLRREAGALARIRDPAEITLDDVTWADVLILDLWDIDMADPLVSLVKAAGRKLVITVDADFLGFGATYPALRAHYEEPDRQRRLKRLLGEADAVVTHLGVEKWMTPYSDSIFTISPSLGWSEILEDLCGS